MDWNTKMILRHFLFGPFCVSLIIHYKPLSARRGYGIFYTNFRNKNKSRVTGTLIRVAYFCLVKFYLKPIVEARHVVEMNKIYISAFGAPVRLRMGSLDAALMEFWSLPFVSIMTTELFVVVDLNFTLQLMAIKSYLPIIYLSGCLKTFRSFHSFAFVCLISTVVIVLLISFVKFRPLLKISNTLSSNETWTSPPQYPKCVDRRSSLSCVLFYLVEFFAARSHF